MLHALDFSMPVLSLPKWLHQGYMTGASLSPWNIPAEPAFGLPVEYMRCTSIWHHRSTKGLKP